MLGLVFEYVLVFAGGLTIEVVMTTIVVEREILVWILDFFFGFVTLLSQDSETIEKFFLGYILSTLLTLLSDS